jgi:DNA-binding FadR family transcriptional regulator
MAEANKPSEREDGKGSVTAAAIHAALMQAIRSGRFSPGSQLPNERQLAERYGASRQQVRDALLLLSETELIERKVGSGTWLSEAAAGIIERMDTAADLRSLREHSQLETIEARLIIEPGVAALAARNSTQARLLELKTALDAVRGPASWLDFKSRIDQFARAYYVASNNRFLLWTFDHMLSSRQDAKADGHRASGAVAELVRRHSHEQLAQIYRAIADGDETRAEAVTRNYLVGIAASSGLS